MSEEQQGPEQFAHDTERKLRDRIEQLERRLDTMQDRLDAANKARANAMSLAVTKQAKLAKAVEALRYYADGLGMPGLARTTLAELEGKE